MPALSSMNDAKLKMPNSRWRYVIQRRLRSAAVMAAKRLDP